MAGVPVRDYAKAEAWYTQLLGDDARIGYDTDEAWEIAHGAYLWIYMRPEHAGHALHIMYVREFDTFISQIAERGLQPDERGDRSATFRDPDGNKISVTSYPTSWTNDQTRSLRINRNDGG